MKLKDFAVERYFAKYEFTVQYMLSSSDCDGYSMNYILDLASEKEIEQWNNLKLGYTETLGSVPLRQSIIQHYQTIQLDEIIVSSPGEANFILMNILLNAGDHVICMSPTYQSLYQIARNLGCSISFWEPSENNNKWYYDPADLGKFVKPRTKLIVINFPHNPTGYSPNLQDYNEIIEIASQNGISLFSDEMYRFLNHSEKDVLPSACDLYENAISLWGTAKTFGLAGLRLGWLTSKDKELLKKVESFKDYLSICNSAPSEILATIALNNLDRFLKPNLEKIKANIKIFTAFHDRNNDFFDFPKPDSGSTAFIKLKINETAMNFAEQLVKDTGIMLLPSEAFEYGTSYARIGFGRHNMSTVLGILENYINEENYH
ncbi:MAG: aminotransferase class I/II-fold pyridoxal phosphate-dependent enzyme [Saprospiraceae bacterium]|nr:aminotransferase class I/II-fold pyridoxal phosphate-dependent enzyme [Saprospiraceae bacterium]